MTILNNCYNKYDENDFNHSNDHYDHYNHNNHKTIQKNVHITYINNNDYNEKNGHYDHNDLYLSIILVQLLLTFNSIYIYSHLDMIQMKLSVF